MIRNEIIFLFSKPSTQGQTNFVCIAIIFLKTYLIVKQQHAT